MVLDQIENFRVDCGWGITGLLPVLLLASIALAGCLGSASPADVDVPRFPQEVTAVYDVRLDGETVMNVTVQGTEQAVTQLGDESRQESVKLTIKYEREGHREWKLELHHIEDGSRLLTADLQCSGQAGEEFRKACPSNNPETYSLWLPDAFSAPGMLGLGPFLGETVQMGDEGRLDLWDPVDPGSIAWQAHKATNRDNRSCVNLNFEISNQAAKTPISTLPYNRSLVTCDGLPVPVELSAGPIKWELRDWRSEGTRSSSMEANLPSKPIRGGLDECSIDFPPHNKTKLPSPNYMEWAQDNDSNVQEWLQNHPDGFAFPSVAHSSTTGSGTTSNSYVVQGLLVLFDEESGSGLVLAMTEEHRRTLVLEESSFEQSDRLGTISGIPEPDEHCPREEVEMTELTSTIEANLPDGICARSTFLAPELGAGIQGLTPWASPYQPTDEGQPDTRDVFNPPSWPYRAYVTHFTCDGGAGVLTAASLDPAGDWIRWVEQDPPS